MKNPPIYKSSTGEQLIMDLYDQIFQQWPVPHTGLMVPTRYGDTFVIASGPETAPPLVLLHGSCSNALTWAGDVTAYSQHFRVYAIDIIGEPGKSAQNRPALTSLAYGEWLSDVFAALQLESAAMVGYSMGGWMAVKFANRYPEKISKLVLMAPGGIGPARISFTFKLIGYSLCGKWGQKQIKRLTCGDETLPADADRFLDAIARFFRPRMVLPLIADEELQRLTMPVFLIAGEQDMLLQTAKTVERLQHLVPHSTLKIFPKAGHLLLNTPVQILPFLVQ